jgi:xanthine dehydrogenase/oxidase
LGTKKDGLNPIQQRLAENNASQCGYCTPGFVMSMYSLLKRDHKPTKEQIEKSFDGNICRCTGYRAILDSMKSFAKDERPINDIEDLLVNTKCIKDSAACCKAAAASSSNNCEIKRGDREFWHSPTNLADLVATVKQVNQQQQQQSSQLVRVKFVSGNTSSGVYKQLIADRNNNVDVIEHFISVKNVQELHKIEKSAQALTIGAVVTLTDMVEAFESTAKSDASNFGHLAESARALQRVGSGHVRNVATWSGNLALKRANVEFPSDVFVVLESAGAVLNVFQFAAQFTDGLSLKCYIYTKIILK